MNHTSTFLFFTILTSLTTNTLVSKDLDLTQSDLNHLTQSWGKAQKNKSIDGKTLSIAGKQFTSGIGTHASSSFRWKIMEKGTRFTAKVGVDDEVGKNGSVEFIIEGEKQILWRSGIIRGGDTAKEIDIIIDEPQIINLKITDGNNGNSYDHANWISPKFTAQKTLPKIFKVENDIISATELIKTAQVLPDGSRLVTLPKKTYNFYDEGCEKREYYISNHDQVNPKSVGLAFENINNITIDGQGSTLLCDGRMLPISLINCKNITLKNFHIDFTNPHITQMTVIENNPKERYIILKPASWVKYKIVNKRFIAYGNHWEHTPCVGMAFVGKTRHIVPGIRDFGTPLNNVEEIKTPNGEILLKVNNWHSPLLVKDTVIAFRTWGRPTPGIFVTHSKNVKFENVQVHYSEGMALLAQMSENIHLDRFGVCLKGENDQRYFTSQADATHFSGCKGLIISENGLYEGMMDDAINVHGTYLKITKRINDTTLQARYQHGQAWGFEWGLVGDDVQFVKSSTMEIVGNENKIVAIRPIDKTTVHGAKLYEISFEKPLDPQINENQKCGIENLTWTPEVIFRKNIIRNNRARGSLFSTPRKTIVEDNFFDHTSGTAILLCGDCNGWYETGACRDITIRNNRFLNSLTNYYQFTNAIISIYPEIPNLRNQQKYFHGGKENSIVIENNLFETFDKPLLYIKSCDGLIFRNNKIVKTTDFRPFHNIKHAFFFEKVKNIRIENNQFYPGFNIDQEIQLKMTDIQDVKIK